MCLLRLADADRKTNNTFPTGMFMKIIHKSHINQPAPWKRVEGFHRCRFLVRQMSSVWRSRTGHDKNPTKSGQKYQNINDSKVFEEFSKKRKKITVEAVLRPNQSPSWLL